MSLIDVISGFAGSGILGAAGGIAKSWIDGRTTVKLKELDQSHEIAMTKEESRLAELQLTHEKSLAMADQQFKVDMADLNNLAESFKHDKANYANVDVSKTHWAFILVDFARGITRPAITWMLLAYLMFIATYTTVKYGVTFTPEELSKMTVEIVTGLLYTSVMATGWWFGSRNKWSVQK